MESFISIEPFPLVGGFHIKVTAMEKAGIILIHGAGFGAFIWNELIPRLQNPALAVDFPNRNNPAKNQNLHFDDYVEHVIQQIDKWIPGRLIIVTHSIGGCVGLKVAENYKNRIAGFVGISSAIPENGNSFISCLPFLQQKIMPFMLNFFGTSPPPKTVDKNVCHDLSAVQKQKVLDNYTAESKFLYLERCNAPIPDTRKLYLKLENDREFSGAIQDKMAQNLGVISTGGINSGHLPMLSQPVKLAAALNNFANSLTKKVSLTT